MSVTISLSRMLLLGSSPIVALSGLITLACAQTQTPGETSITIEKPVVVTAPSPIVRRVPARPTPARTATQAPQPAPAAPAPALQGPQPGTLPIVTDQFATVTVVPNEEIRRHGGGTLGDLLFSKPGITGSEFAPGASSRPIIRGLDVNRVRIQENGIGANGASDLGEDHFVPVDPLSTDQVEVIRGPATLRYGSQAIGGVVETTNNRIPDALPCRDDAALPVALPGMFTKAPAKLAASPCVRFETRGAVTTVDDGLNGAALLDAGGGNFAIHADAFGRQADDYRIPQYPYLVPPSPAEAPQATQPGAFNGKQPNSSLHTDGESIGGSYIFSDGFIGLALTQNNALYHIPGIDGEDHHTRIDAHQTKLMSKGEWRAPVDFIDAVRFWAGATDYKHNEIGLADDTDLSSDGVRQIFTNKEQEVRIETQLAPFDLRFASLTSAIGVQAGHQELTAPSPDNAGLWDPNSNVRAAAFMFNEFRFSDTTKAQVAGRIERVDLSGFGRSFPGGGVTLSTPVSPGYTPKSASIGLIQDLPWDLVASVTAQYVERAPKPAELFSGGAHDATGTFDKGNPNLQIEVAESVEVGLRRNKGPIRFEATAYYTRFNGFIFRNLTGNTCDPDTADCGPGVGDPNVREALYSQRDAIFRGAEFQSQWDALTLGMGVLGVEDQFDVVRATFTDGTNVPRIPPVRVGGGLFYRDDTWLARVNLLHAFAQNDIAVIGETPTPGYNDLRAEVSYRWKPAKLTRGDLSEVVLGVSGSNLLNEPIRNAVSYNKDEVLMPGLGVRVFANVKY
jgi:iron complex outermembrane receptor protein